MRTRSARPARWQQLPAGVRDLAPQEAERRAAVVAAIRDEVRRWGYREVATPVLEHLETMVQGGGGGIQDGLFKIVDQHGQILALRPDLTVPIARLAATRLLPAAAGPLRLSYVGPVFRGGERGLREFTQAGVELLGDARPDADAEVIALAAACLERAGVRDAAVSVGHLGFLDDLLGGLPEDERDEVRGRLYRKAFVGLEDAVGERGRAAALRRLPELHGPDAIAVARSLAPSPRSAAALDQLEDLVARVREHGVERVTVDLTIIRDLGYYTGMVFEAYAPGNGYPLLGGGRYDGLLGRFGVDCPATGFALGLERVEATLPESTAPSVDVLLAADPAFRSRALALARQLRRNGRRVVVEAGIEWPEAIRRAAAEGIPFVARVEAEGAWLREPRGERAVGDLVAEFAPRAAVWSH